MTDTRVGRVADKVLLAGTPDARVGRVADKVLLAGTPDARVGRVAMKVLVQLYIPVQVIQSYGPGNGLGFRHWQGPPISYKVLH